MTNKIIKLFNIEYPIIQGGMIWCSEWQLVAAVSNAGGLGLLGSGSMKPEVLRQQIRKTKKATNKTFGVNIPLLYPHTEETIKIIIDEKVPVVFTSAGNPKTYTKFFHDNGVKVAHVIANSKFVSKCEQAGVDAIVAEGFEAGGHNGREETSSMVLIQAVRQITNLPIIAAGGISNGQAMLASFILGADAVQMGSRFVASTESSAHINFKNEVLKANEGSTKLTLKQLTPVRLIKNSFFNEVEEAQLNGVNKEDLQNLLGKGRAKSGMYNGDINDGELEIGQVSSLIKNIISAEEIIKNTINEYNIALQRVKKEFSGF